MADKPMFNGVLQVAVVVRNLDEAMKKYWDGFGIGPWRVYTFDPSTVDNMIIREKRVDHAMRLAVTSIGKVHWELIEPLDDKSIYAEFLQEHGEGLHHVALGVDDYDETVAACRSKGIGVLQGGTFHGLTYTYLDTLDALSVITEIYSPRAQGDKAPPPDATYP